MKRKPRVIVVGAGPAGSSTAAHLAGAGQAEVILLERGTVERTKVCAGGLGPSALRELRHLDMQAQVLSQSYPIRGLLLHAPSGRRATLQGRMAAAVIERSRLDAMMARHAETLGARLVEGWKVTGLLTEGARVGGVRGPRGSIEGDLVILAAGGTTSLTKGPHRTLLCLRRHVSGVLHGKGRMEIVLRERTAPGYAWLFPEGDGMANIGLCLPRTQTMGKESLVSLLDDIQHNELAQALAHADVGPDEFMGIRCSLRAKAPNRPGLWVTGEAAGLANAVTGEGIGQAMTSGRLAAAAASIFRETGEAVARRHYEHTLDLQLTPSLASAALVGRIVAQPILLDGLAVLTKSPLGRLASRVTAGLVSP